MVWRLDRPGRALQNLIARAEALRIQGVGLKSLKEAIDTDSVCSGAAFVRTQQVFGYLSIQPATYVACTTAHCLDIRAAHACGIVRRGNHVIPRAVAPLLDHAPVPEQPIS